jgi:hypothetical protein
VTDPSMMPPPPAKTDEPGVLDDLLEIFTSPAKVFARRAKGGGGLAFIVVSLVLGGLLYSGKNVMEPIMEAQMRKGMATAQARNPQMTAQQLEAGIAMQKKLMPVFMVLGAPIALFGLGLLIWVVAKVFGAAVTFGFSMVIASLAYVPRIIGAIITDIQGLMMSDTSHLVNPSQLSIGPARFLDPATSSELALAVATRFDLLTIWVTVLVGIAYASGGKLDRNKAIAAGVTLWVLGGLPALWGALRAG